MTATTTTVLPMTMPTPFTAGSGAKRRPPIVLPDLGDKPLVFDFSDVRDPSSSFFDELFGRIALHIGLDTFTQRCSLEGLSAAAIDRANVVIHQRVSQGDALPDWDDEF